MQDGKHKKIYYIKIKCIIFQTDLVLSSIFFFFKFFYARKNDYNVHFFRSCPGWYIPVYFIMFYLYKSNLFLFKLVLDRRGIYIEYLLIFPAVENVLLNISRLTM